MNNTVLHDLTDIIALAVGIAGLVQLYRQSDRRFLVSVAGLFLALLAGWTVYVRIDRYVELRRTQEGILQILRGKPSSRDEIVTGLPFQEFPFVSDALDSLQTDARIKSEYRGFPELSTGRVYWVRIYYPTQ